MNGVVFRQGHKVVLRPLERADLHVLCVWMNDPEVTHFLARVLPVGEREEEEWLNDLYTRKNNVVLGIVVKDEGKLIGTIGLHNIDHIHGHAVTGTVIGDKEYWGKGYGTEAKMLLLEMAFERLNLQVIRSDVIAYNNRSRKYGEKCGYRKVGRIPQWISRYGKRHDEIVLAVTARRWRPLWEAYCRDPEGFLKHS